MAKEIVVGTANNFNWVVLGALSKHPDEGKIFDLSQSINESTGTDDADVKLVASTGYGDASKIRQLMKMYNPDAIMIFTDPRYWTWLFDIEREIRTKIPITYLSIWDNWPLPLWNQPYYESCDLHMCISKQTKTMTKMLLERSEDYDIIDLDEKSVQPKINSMYPVKIIKYVPHGINSDTFYPISPTSDKFEKVLEIKKQLGVDDKEFILLFNSRNIHRKRPADLILAYKEFCDKIGKEAAKKCALVMHTVAVDSNGTDLGAVIDAFCDPTYVTVKITNRSYSPEQMNYLYNASDACALISSNEGWGLSLTEAMMSAKMIIANVTGGMQDQMRFEDDNGKWLNFSADLPSNHRGTYKKHGDWAVPVFPSNISVMGSVPTPYIYDDRASIEDIRDAIIHVHNLPKEVRDANGMKGREWVLSDESGMSARMMCNNVVDSLEEVIEKFTPRSSFDLIKVESTKSKLIPHKLYEY